jgi:hypothetical protein
MKTTRKNTGQLEKMDGDEDCNRTDINYYEWATVEKSDCQPLSAERSVMILSFGEALDSKLNFIITSDLTCNTTAKPLMPTPLI